MQRIVFDLGMNNGDDTEYYLAKNYRVIAVEANPHLCEEASVRFKSEISNNQLSILNVAIADSTKECIFYINTANDHWSSLDITWAARNGTKAIPYPINGRTLPDLIQKYGVPYFLKIDIEGGDMTVLLQIAAAKLTPPFLSVEDCRFGYEYLELLHEMGYKRFKLSNQTLVPTQVDSVIPHQFRMGASGMFGDELAGEWLAYDIFLDHYAQTVRSRETMLKIGPPHVWWDIHCSK